MPILSFFSQFFLAIFFIDSLTLLLIVDVITVPFSKVTTATLICIYLPKCIEFFLKPSWKLDLKLYLPFFLLPRYSSTKFHVPFTTYSNHTLSPLLQFIKTNRPTHLRQEIHQYRKTQSRKSSRTPASPTITIILRRLLHTYKYQTNYINCHKNPTINTQRCSNIYAITIERT